MAIRRNRRAMPNLLKRKSSATQISEAKTESTPNTTRFRARPRHLDAVEKMNSLLEPDVLSPVQYFDTVRPNPLKEPEKKLMVAILEDAITCFQDNVLVESGKRKKLFDEAEAWLFQEGSTWIFSFRNVSELLGVDPEYLRGGLMRWREKQLAREVSRRFLEETKMAG
jgi:hypothetical protein